MPTQATSLARLYLMQVASVPPMNIPAVCYLVQTAGGSSILIDTGLPGPELLPDDLTAELSEDVLTQIAKLDLKPEDITTVVCTHFDMDHSGHHDAFPNAQFVVQRSHYDDAQNNPRFEATRAIWNQDPDRFIFVEGDHELVPGFTLVETTGHTVGHQSVLLTLPQTGGVLLTIDAVDSEANFSMDRDVSPMNEDEEAVRASTAKLLDIASQDEVALVIFGHDPQQWESLKKLPDYYA